MFNSYVTSQGQQRAERPHRISQSSDVSNHTASGTGEGAEHFGIGKRQEYVEGNLKILNTIETSSEVMCVKYSPDGLILAAGLSDGSIRIYNPDTGQCLYSLGDDETQCARQPVTSLQFQPAAETDKIERKHIIMATYASGLVKFWHYSSNSCLYTCNEKRQTLYGTYSPLGNRLVTVGDDTKIYVYDVASHKRIRTMQASDNRDVMTGHKQRVFVVKYHPLDNNLFISGGWDDTVQFWDERQDRAMRRISGPHICGEALDIDATHNHILTGSWRKENVLQIWDFNTCGLLRNVPQDPMHGSALYCAQWLGRENIVCGGCGHNMARIIDRGTLNTVGQLVELPGGVYCIDNDHSGNKPKVAAGAACKIYILKMERSTAV